MEKEKIIKYQLYWAAFEKTGLFVQDWAKDFTTLEEALKYSKKLRQLYPKEEDNDWDLIKWTLKGIRTNEYLKKDILVYNPLTKNFESEPKSWLEY